MAFKYPLQVRFKTIAIAEQIYVRDADGVDLLYVKQKLFKLKEKVEIFRDSTKSELLYTLQADRVIDWSPEYTLSDKDGNALGTIKREGAKSIWRSSYMVSIGGKPLGTVHESNPWTKVIDGLVGEIPIIGLVSNYLFHPRYAIDSVDGERLGEIEKRPAFFEGSFMIHDTKLSSLNETTQQHLIALLMAVSLLEQGRG
jgi:hypothetical protein